MPRRLQRARRSTVWDSDWRSQRTRKPFQIGLDGTSHTIFFFEMSGKPDHWKQARQQPTPRPALQFYSHGPWAGNNGVGVYNWSQDGTTKGCRACERFVNVDNELSPLLVSSGHRDDRAGGWFDTDFDRVHFARYFHQSQSQERPQRGGRLLSRYEPNRSL